MRWRQWRATDRRIGLRARVVIAFGVGAALVSAALAFITFTIVQSDLMTQRRASVRRQAVANARLLRHELAGPMSSPSAALASLSATNGTHGFIYRQGSWFSASAPITAPQIPVALSQGVLAGHVTEELVHDGRTPSLVAGVPIPSVGAFYFEDHPLAELEGTLALLATVLIATAAATTFGGAVAGLWASRRLIRPLRDVAGVATDIAGGALERRLPADPDLKPFVSSFNAMVAALQERIERDARFASDVSHELRSPITTISASVELLQSYRAVMPEGANVAVEMLHFEVARFTTMVEDLLEISRMDAGAHTLALADVPVAELVRRTVATRHPAVPVEVGPQIDGLQLRVDKRRLQRVIENLLDNADAYAGGATAVAVFRRGDRVVVAVEDAGPGVAPEERGRIFERFYRGAASGRRGDTSGTGLGLALVAEHVRAHRGDVRVEARAQGGARFLVELPICGG